MGSNADKKDIFNPKLVHLLDCPACHYITRSIDQYFNHIYVNHSNKEINFQISECTFCNLKATNNGFLDEHTQYSHDAKVDWRPLTFVSMNFFNYSNFTNCKLCSAILPNREALNCHYESYHRITDIKSCLIFKIDSKSTSIEVDIDSDPLKSESDKETSHPVISNVISVHSDRDSGDLLPPTLSPQRRIECDSGITVEFSEDTTIAAMPDISDHDSDGTNSMRQTTPPTVATSTKTPKVPRELLALFNDQVNLSDNGDKQNTAKSGQQSSLTRTATSLSQKARRSNSQRNLPPTSPKRVMTRRSQNSNSTSSQRLKLRRSVREGLLAQKSSIRRSPRSINHSSDKKDAATSEDGSKCSKQTPTTTATSFNKSVKNVAQSQNGAAPPAKPSPAVRKRHLKLSSASVCDTTDSESDSSLPAESIPLKYRVANHTSTKVTSVKNKSLDSQLSLNCPSCSEIFDNFTSMRLHHKSVHKKSGETERTENNEEVHPFTCHLCGKHFLRENGLTAHLIFKHKLNRDGSGPFKAACLSPDLAHTDRENVSRSEGGNQRVIVKTPSKQLHLNQCSRCYDTLGNCNEFLSHMDINHQFNKERYCKTKGKGPVNLLRPCIKLESLESLLILCEEQPVTWD